LLSDLHPKNSTVLSSAFYSTLLCINDLKAAIPVPGATMTIGTSGFGKIIVPFLSQTGIGSVVFERIHPEQTPTFYLLLSVSYSVTAIVRST